MKKETVVFDFDGVIHSYKSPWQGADFIPDAPVVGIREAIADIRKLYNVVVVSSRCIVPEGMKAVKDYLEKTGIEVDAVMAEKPPAIVYIDDRAICFDGKPSKLLSKITNFVPWNKNHISSLKPCPFCGKTPKTVLISCAEFFVIVAAVYYGHELVRWIESPQAMTIGYVLQYMR
nr:MAG TPA: hypothetical protein [Caudoviricetes sp.]